MKNIFLLITLLTLIVCISCEGHYEKQSDSITKNQIITIEGHITIENTKNPPKGINTINITNRWNWENKMLNAKSDNVKAYVSKNGYYKLNIKKGDTIKFIPSPLLYETNLPAYTITNINKNSIINFNVRKNKAIHDYNLKLATTSKYHHHLINLVNPDSIISVTGQLKHPHTKENLENAYIVLSGIVNTEGTTAAHLTDSLGRFSVQIPSHAGLTINALDPANSMTLYPTKDTIIHNYKF